MYLKRKSRRFRIYLTHQLPFEKRPECSVIYQLWIFATNSRVVLGRRDPGGLTAIDIARSRDSAADDSERIPSSVRQIAVVPCTGSNV